MQVVVKNLITNYEVQGQGAILVLLHGWGANLHSFDLIFKKLVEKYQVYVLDFPGFGKTQVPLEPWSVDDYVNFVEVFLEKMQIKSACFLGHSFGARVLIKLACKKPELIQNLILTGAAGIKPKNSLKKICFRMIAKTGRVVFSLPVLSFFQKTVQRQLYKIAGAEDYLQAGVLKQTFLNVIEEDLTPCLKQITTPTLLIWGEKDQDTPLKDGKLMQAKLQKAQLEVLPLAGHYAFIDQPKEFTQIVLNYLTQKKG